MKKTLSLYHGSEKVIEKPVFGFGKSSNDYGRGFYCTQDLELAKEWACQNNEDGFVNEYELDLEGMKLLNLASNQYSILHWITMLIENRHVDSIENNAGLDFLKKNYHIDSPDYDIIVGYRADDSYFAYARDFMNNAISLESLEKAVCIGNLGMQVMIKSEKAFNRLDFKDSVLAQRDVYFKKILDRDSLARAYYRNRIRSSGIEDSPLLIDLMRMSKRKENSVNMTSSGE